MAGFTITRNVAAPPRQVFQFFSDLELAPERITAIRRVEILNPGPVGEGTRWRETRVVFNRECTEELVITRFEPDRCYSAECESCGARFVSTFEFVPRGAGTAIRVTVEAIPVSLMAKLFSPLTGLLMSSCRRATEQDVDELLQGLEATAGQPADDAASGSG